MRLIVSLLPPTRCPLWFNISQISKGCSQLRFQGVGSVGAVDSKQDKINRYAPGPLRQETVLCKCVSLAKTAGIYRRRILAKDSAVYF